MGKTKSNKYHFDLDTETITATLPLRCVNKTIKYKTISLTIFPSVSVVKTNKIE